MRRRAAEAPLGRRLGDAAAAVVGVTAVGALSAVAVHHGCFHPPPPVTRPDPGTSRASYCDAVIAGKPWILFTVVPAAAMALAAILVSSRRIVLLVMLVLCLGLAGGAIVANSLTSALTI